MKDNLVIEPCKSMQIRTDCEIFDHQCLTSSFQGLLSQHALVPCSMLRIKLFQVLDG